MEGQTNAVQALFDNKSDINSIDLNGDSLLYDYFYKFFIGIIQCYVKVMRYYMQLWLLKEEQT